MRRSTYGGGGGKVSCSVQEEGKGAAVYKVRGKVNWKLLREMASTNDVAETIERTDCNHCREVRKLF